MPKISIIMPVYNSEKYLNEAIDSLINQTLKDIEIILIDDGSIDRSPKICDDIAKRDNRVIVKHIKNGGISNARNVGLKIAKSKYIMFMDHDDIFDTTACEENYELIQKYNLDMIKFGRKEIFINGKIIEKEDIRSFKDRILEKQDLEEDKMNLFYNGVFDCVWDGIFKKDILVNFDTSFKLGGEDVIFGLEMFTKLRKIMLRSKVYYYHYIRIGISTSTKYNEDLIKDIKKIYSKYQEILGKDEKINCNKYNMRIINCFITTIVMNLSNPKCKLSKKEKMKALDSLDIKLKPKNNLLKLIKLSPIYTLILILYKYKMYSLLLSLGSLYKVTKIKHIEHKMQKEGKYED